MKFTMVEGKRAIPIREEERVLSDGEVADALFQRGSLLVRDRLGREIKVECWIDPDTNRYFIQQYRVQRLKEGKESYVKGELASASSSTDALAIVHPNVKMPIYEEIHQRRQSR